MVHFRRSTIVEVRRSKLIGSSDNGFQLFRRIII